MIYILLSISLSSLIVIAFKIFTRFGISNLQAIIVNYIVAAVLGFSLSGSFSDIPAAVFEPWFIYALLIGFFLMFVFNVYAVSAQKAGIALTAVSGKMSVVIPVVAGAIIYNETMGWIRIAGIVTALLALYLTFKSKEKRVYNPWTFVLPAILFLGTGTNDSLLNYAQRKLIHGDQMYFLSVCFLISLIFGLLFLLGKSFFKPEKFVLKNIVGGVILGLLNFGSTYYFLVCLGLYESSVFFPVFNVSIVSIAALAGYFIFKEKLSLINRIGIGLAAGAIIIIAITA
ncbi:MAG: EamA-like transporter family protein [Bacteroidetes bacterium ADurb.Bin408]|nr:MAG: EamA-like transporter family protein [Bacteroidetes bacterium ADurb.Bin408]